MADSIKTSKKVFIRNSGFNEYWLQDRIYEDPTILGLGNLVTVSKEKKQSTGGRLDILLKDPEDNSMYEVEVMLGETDPSHIIRSIEYWDIEKRKYPQRQHFSVLVAESFGRRYFNVLQILSLNIPMIAIQADLLEVENERILNFTKLLDVYEEPEDEEASATANENSWAEKFPWTLDTAKHLLGILASLDGELTFSFTQSYIKIIKQGKTVYGMSRKADPRSHFWFKEENDEKIESIKQLLDKKKIEYDYKRNYFSMTVDKKFLSANETLLREIHKIHLGQESESEQ